MFLAGGVLAAFECKITLKPDHLPKFFKTAKSIKNLTPLKGYRNIYEETHSPIYVGLLAHSHNWSKNGTVERIGNALHKNDIKLVTKPIEIPDLFCIADTCTWTAKKWLAPQINYYRLDVGECIMTDSSSDQRENPTITQKSEIAIPIATALKSMIHRLSKEHEGLRSLALYFQSTITDSGGGFVRYWPIKEVFSERNQEEYKKVGRHPEYFFPMILNTPNLR